MSIDYQFDSHYINKQHEAEGKFLSQYHSASFTFENPYVVLNPYLIAPLTALILFKTDKEETVSICVKGKDETGDMKFRFSAATEHQIPVYGLYADYLNTIVLTLGSGGQKIIQIKTDPLVKGIETPSKMETTPEYFGDHVMILSPSAGGKVVAYDLNGDVRWYTTINLIFDIKRLRNGRLLVGTERLLKLPYVMTGLYEMGMIGKIYNEYRMPGGIHHDAIELEDGNFVCLSEEMDRDTVEDMCVMLERKTGNIIKTWDLRAILPRDAGGGPRSSSHDWLHTNSVWYDKATNSLTISGRNLDILANFDFDTDEINWLLGDPNKWPQEFVEKYFFSPDSEKEFDWFYAQHSGMLLPDGDVFVFDNGAWRSKYADQDIPAEQKFSRGVRYRIDKQTRKVTQVWQYGKERGSEFFAPHISNVEYYAEGHYMVHSGDIGNIKGVPCVKPPVFYLGKPEEKDLIYYAITVEVKDDQVMYEMKVPGAYYRAEKLKLYCEDDVLTFGKGELLGTLGVTSEVGMKLPKTSRGMLPEEIKVSIYDEEDRLKITGHFAEGSYVVAVLFGEDNSTHKYLVPTTEKDELALCVGTFQHGSADSSVMISKEGLSGNYEVKLLLEGKLYDTGVTIHA
ncbi:MAG: aryl sulfotransferase [Firmicutes bacterium]|nr:aryl sulfotransferase [Bacillota bacterium]